MNVHIADNHKLIVDGFSTLLKNNNINVVGSSNNGLEVINWFQKNKADILILDISMPLRNGIEVVEYFKSNNLDQKIIIVSEYLNLIFLKKTIGNGASGYISKTFAAATIIDALHKVYNGGIYFSLDIQELLIDKCLSFKQDGDRDFATILLEKKLSKQEMNILLMHSEKYNSTEISEKLKISKSTIRTYIARIKEKLNSNPKEGYLDRLAYLKQNPSLNV